MVRPVRDAQAREEGQRGECEQATHLPDTTIGRVASIRIRMDDRKVGEIEV
jgi:hypothetical protein